MDDNRVSLSLVAFAAGLCAFAGGCASGGGGNQGPDTGRALAAAADSIRIADVNQRILATGGRGFAGAREAEEYRIGPRDQIEVEVFGVDTFSGTFRVEESGTVALPLLGSLDAAGNTPRDLERLIEVRLRETFMRDPHVTVHVVEVLSRGVSVIGSVRRPGVYQIPGRSTLLEVLALAEGLTETAGNSVFVVRPDSGPADSPDPLLFQEALLMEGADSVPRGPGGEVIEVDLGALLEYGRADANVEVLPGDIVQVRPAGLVYVVGEVNRPGGFTIPPGAPMTVLQALAMAQGLQRAAKADGAVIVRHAEDGSTTEVAVDLEKVLKGSIPPPSLFPRDVLFVPRNGGKAFALGVVNALVGMVTFRGLIY